MIVEVDPRHQALHHARRPAPAGARGHQPPAARRRDRRPARQVGFGQVHPAALHRRARSPRPAGPCRYRGTPLNGANPGVAMVFQSFALLPWLTVQANVEMGLEARGVPPAERHQRALEDDRPDRSRRLRAGLPQGTLGRHAPAGRLRPGPGGRTRRPVDGRAVQRPRRAHRREPADRAAEPVGRQGLPDQGHPHRHPQHRRGGADGRPHLRAVRPTPAGSEPRSTPTCPGPATAGPPSSRPSSTRSTGS